MTGWKTYAGCAALAVVTIANAMGWIDGETYITVTGLVAAWTGISLRAAVKKVER